ncbi:MAG: endolytic transglycosylase MltG [Solobacterium sp.]|nr:endolytic transglycosylase MltG [Solobacterium sp.]
MTSRKRPKKRKLKIGRLLLLILVPVVLIAGGVWAVRQTSLEPMQETSEEVIFEVESGTNAKQVCTLLKEKGLLRNDSYAYYYIRKENLTDVKSGRYTLNKNMGVRKIFEILTDPNAGEVDTVSVTIIEGDWAKHVAQKISEQTNVTYDELIALWNDEAYIRSLMERYPFITEEVFNPSVRIRLEGYLAPNTYLFYPETDAKTVTEKILDESLKIYEKHSAEIAESDYSIHELYTLASIVQYESGKIDDMKLIAGVFYNRLKIDMPMQSSVTVCYAMDNDEGENWLACEANADFDSPYNTYKYPGLPPGPIVNAGEEALIAVLEPQESDYYYFMADVNTGVVYYAKTLDEHNANVQAHTTYH